MDGLGGFADIPEALDDIKVIRQGLKRLKFKSEELLLLKNPSYQEIKVAIDQSSRDIYQNNIDGKKTLLFVYYAGHGMMDNTTFCVLNATKSYPLEKMLRTIAKQDGSFVMSLFDCCREKLNNDQKAMLNTAKKISSVISNKVENVPEEFKIASRGGGGVVQTDDLANEDETGLKDSQENFIITFGC